MTESPGPGPDADLPDDQQQLKLDLCQERIGYTFRDRTLLLAALTHASSADSRLASNERLEFLGDAILGAVVCEYLYDTFPNFLEGDLTRIKSVVVSRLSCAKFSREMGLEECLIVGKGMAANADVPASLMADVFESLAAAIYLDSGDESAREFIFRYVTPEVELVESGELGGNYKSSLQQFAQRDCGTTPTYLLLDEKGPDHSKQFYVAAQIKGRRYHAAWGRNKKEAEQRAAHNALAELTDQPIPYVE
ncbi:MAG TPA: ribonuclease III [Pirellulaceae bacterium]|jgi:ribonuclease-3|nr:ribonuclease III [Pirellulaceae bacterium]